MATYNWTVPTSNSSGSYDSIIRALIAKGALGNQKIQSWSQGANQMAQAALLGLMDREQSANDAANAKALGNIAFGAPPVASTPPSAITAPQAPTTPPAQQSIPSAALNPTPMQSQTPGLSGGFAPQKTTNNATGVQGDIVNAALKYGLNPQTMLGIGSIESSLNPTSNANNANTKYKGLFQLGPDEWQKYGQGDIYNAQNNADAAAKLLADRTQQFRALKGRDPTPTELYMMHQQGPGFITNGTMTNIAGNAYPGMSGPQTPQSFQQGWGNELARRMARFPNATTQTANLSPLLGPASASAAPLSPPMQTANNQLPPFPTPAIAGFAMPSAPQPSAPQSPTGVPMPQPRPPIQGTPTPMQPMTRSQFLNAPVSSPTPPTAMPQSAPIIPPTAQPAQFSPQTGPGFTPGALPNVQNVPVRTMTPPIGTQVPQAGQPMQAAPQGAQPQTQAQQWQAQIKARLSQIQQQYNAAIARRDAAGAKQWAAMGMQLQQQLLTPPETKSIVVGDRIYSYDPRMQKATDVTPAGVQPDTPDIRNYKLYAAQAQKNGQQPMPFEDYQIRLKQAGRQQVNINQQAESSFEKAYGTHEAEQAADILAAGDKASTNLQKSALLKNLLTQMQTGKLAPAATTIGAWAQSAGINPSLIGIDPKTPVTGQAINGIANEMVLGKIGKGGFPANNFSEQDRKFMLTTIPQLSDQPGSAAIKLEVSRRLDQLSVMKANEWAAARDQHKTFDQFSSEWRRKMQGMNIFGDLMQQAKQFAPASNSLPPGWSVQVH